MHRRHHFTNRNIVPRRKFKFKGVGILLALISLLAFRFDIYSGDHMIYPTSIGNDVFGNYKVYYRTSPFPPKNDETRFYYINKNRDDIAELMNHAIELNQSVIIHYDKYIGFKGFTAPQESPIVEVDAQFIY